MRTSNAGVPAAGVAGTDELSPAVLASAFGNVDANGFVSRSGYYFQMWLPGDTAGGLVPGVGEAANGGTGATFPNPDNCEIMWACYAWPMDVEGTGNRCFFINQEGDLLQAQNRAATPYTGTTSTPDFDACFQTAGDMSSGLRIGTATGGDGQVWTAVQ
jgi:hypothetical protein